MRQYVYRQKVYAEMEINDNYAAIKQFNDWCFHAWVIDAMGFVARGVAEFNRPKVDEGLVRLSGLLRGWTTRYADFEGMPNNIDYEGFITAERKHQDEKHGVHDHSDCVWLAILNSEVGEVANALLNDDRDNMIKELVQSAAVAEAWATNCGMHKEE